MHDSAASDPGPLHVRLVTAALVTAPVPVNVNDNVMLPANAGFTFNPYS
jgi:hypothetical protein